MEFVYLLCVCVFSHKSSQLTDSVYASFVFLHEVKSFMSLYILLAISIWNCMNKLLASCTFLFCLTTSLYMKQDEWFDLTDWKFLLKECWTIFYPQFVLLIFSVSDLGFLSFWSRTLGNEIKFVLFFITRFCLFFFFGYCILGRLRHMSCCVFILLFAKI